MATYYYSYLKSKFESVLFTCTFIKQVFVFADISKLVPFYNICPISSTHRNSSSYHTDSSLSINFEILFKETIVFTGVVK